MIIIMNILIAIFFPLLGLKIQQL